MSGVWVFKNGVVKLVQNPLLDSFDEIQVGRTAPKKVLVHIPTQEVVSSYAELEEKLLDLGWQRYYNDSNHNNIRARNTYSVNHANNNNNNNCNTYINKNYNTTNNIAPSNNHCYYKEDVIQFHRCFSSSLLISLPADFQRFKLMHMYDIVLKNRQHFKVCDYDQGLKNRTREE